MAQRSGYGQFCPVAKASEVIAERWTPLVLREMISGCNRFNDIHRGVPLMSKSLLSKRLRELEHAGVIVRREIPGEGVNGYFLTEAGESLRPIIIALGEWGQRYVRSNFTHQDLDPSLLMWDIRRLVQIRHLPKGRTVIEFEFTDQTDAQRRWWLLKEAESNEIELCLHDPGYEIDLRVRTDLESMTRVWMGDMEVPIALRSGVLKLDGSATLRLSFQDWIGLSIFAHVEAGAAAS
ncbi:MAG: helix-turn-helix domain-containing protein [Thermomicrobiales bacterium]